MRSDARLAAALALSLGGCAYWQPIVDHFQPPGFAVPGLLVCHGDFAQFANGFMVARPMELKFAVNLTIPSITPLNGGGPGRIIALTPLELSFEVPYQGYKVLYRINRVSGTISQRPSPGGTFFGDCDVKALETKF